jgi:hypothetical protein
MSLLLVRTDSAFITVLPVLNFTLVLAFLTQHIPGLYPCCKLQECVPLYCSVALHHNLFLHSLLIGI